MVLSIWIVMEMATVILSEGLVRARDSSILPQIARLARVRTIVQATVFVTHLPVTVAAMASLVVQIAVKSTVLPWVVFSLDLSQSWRF